MALGIRGANPIWLEVDLQGKLFDDTFYMFVLENTLPYIPADVWHDPNYNVVWDNPIRFLGNGTLPNDIYFEPGKAYRLEFRQGDTQADPLIYEVNNYIPPSGGDTPVDNTSSHTDNQITNPQFSLINFENPQTITGTNPDPIELAPGWTLLVAGTGTVDIERVALNNSNQNPTNAPYALRLTLSGWTTDSVILRQRFDQNGMLWTSQDTREMFVASSVTARMEGAPQNIIATLVDSNDDLLATVLDTTPVSGTWTEYTDHGQMAITQNPDTPPAAYIDYRLALPSNADIYLTSFQLISLDEERDVLFEQDSTERQVDHTFHYYKDQLAEKPIPSYLVGWDFGLNPCQSLGATVPHAVLGGANLSRYIYDQTILFSTVDDSFSTTIDAGGLNITTDNSSSFAFIQYLPLPIVRQLLENKLAVQIQAASTSPLDCEINLYWTDDATLPPLASPDCETLLTAVSATAVQTVIGSWNKIERSNGLGDARFSTGGFSSNTYQVNDFNGWDSREDADIADANFFAIVVSFGTMTDANELDIKYVSLCAGDIATRPAPKTLNQTLKECQYYYISSYNSGVVPGTASNTSPLLSEMLGANSGGNNGVIVRSFGIVFPSEMRTNTPDVTLYSPPVGTSDAVHIFLRNNGAAVTDNTFAVSNWSVNYLGSKSISYISNNVSLHLGTAGANNFPEGYITYHYVSDGRLGLVN